MKFRNRLTAGAVAATTSIGVALSGAVLLAPAQAAPTQAALEQAPALQETDYGYQSTAYGTRVESEVAGLESGSTAFSYLSCTRLAGRHDDDSLADVSLPADDSYIKVESIDSDTRTFRAKAEGIDGAITSFNRIAKVRLGNSSTPRLLINGLQTRSTAWATLSGKLRTSNEITSGGIAIEGLTEEPGTGTPLDDLLEAVNGGINEVLAALIANGGEIEIPGLGLVRVGFDRQVVKPRFAAASSKVLVVTLYGPNQAAGGGDDSAVTIGRTWTRINRDIPAGVMHGVAFGANARLVDGVAQVGRLGEQPLPCNGTEGEVYKSPLAGIDFASAGQLVASGLQGRSFGEQLDSGKASAWTEGSVANLQLGPLELRGIVGRANVAQSKSGKIVANNIKGSSIGEIIVDGESQGGLDPKTAGQAPPIEIPGVAKIEFFVKKKTNRGMKTTAVVITMLPGTPGLSEVRLGTAQVHINRY